jgi:sec-independent protein translocase protein TatC
MLMLAIPMLILVLASEVISRVLDRRKSARRAEDLDDDAVSPI